MEKSNEIPGTNKLFTVKGIITQTSGGMADKIGDAYEYILIGDDSFQNVVVPHPLQNYLESKDEQTFYITRFKTGNVITAVESDGKLKTANEMSVPVNVATIAVALLGITMASSCVASANHYPGDSTGGYILALIVLGGSLWIAKQFDGMRSLARATNRNAEFLQKRQVGK